jgi:hypothetical protein
MLWKRFLCVPSVTVAVLSWTTLAQARPKTDVVVFHNGDRLTCEIKRLDRGRLTVKTDAMSTVSIKWDHVKSVMSNYSFRVELESGLRFFGSIHPLPDEEKLVVAGALRTTELEYPRVVTMVPVEENFWQRIDGSVDFGFNIIQAQSATEYTLNTEVKYLKERYNVVTSLNSLRKTQEDTDPIQRNDLSIRLNWLLRKRWFLVALTSAQQNESQGLKFRGLGGGGAGRFLIHTNRVRLTLIGAGSFNREQYADGEPFRTNVEAIGALGFEFFKFDFPEMDVTTSFAAIPNLTTLGRVRLELSSKARFEIVKNLYWSLNFYNSFDSDPPTRDPSTGDFSRNDFSLTTSLGWTF